MSYIKNKIKKMLINLFTLKKQVKYNEYDNYDELIEKLNNFVIKNDKEPKDIINININKSSKFSWAGAQIFNNNIYFIIDSDESILIYNINTNKTKRIGKLSNIKFKWTGGGIYNNKLYCFPRTSNDLMSVDLINDKIELHDLGLNYVKEHHYGGVLTKEGFIFQPPRNNNYILKINLKDNSISKIYIAPKFLKLRYCGSILHPNGMIYFIPEKGKVICFNPRTNHVSFIGKIIPSYCFDAKICSDGNIYGFSACESGILKIDVKNNTTQMLHTDINFNSYGTKLGVNGNLYNVPGDGDIFYEYNPISDKINIIGETVEKNLNAKCAGGCIDQYGNIYCTPTQGNYIYIIKINNKNKIPNDLYDQFFKDNY